MKVKITKNGFRDYQYGRINIPVAFMRQLRWLIGDEVELSICFSEDSLIITKAKPMTNSEKLSETFYKNVNNRMNDEINKNMNSSALQRLINKNKKGK